MKDSTGCFFNVTMEPKLNFFPQLSLQEMALRSVAVGLVNRPEFRATIPIFRNGLSFELMDEESQWTKRKYFISQLPLPSSMKEEITPIVKAVIAEVIKWKLIHSPHLRDVDGPVHYLCWTSGGAIDYRKTAERVVHSSFVHRLDRFELACLYGLADCIPALWNKLRCGEKEVLSRGIHPLPIVSPYLMLFLPHVLEKRSNISYISLASTLGYSALIGNKSTVEYCCSWVPEEQRKSLSYRMALDVIKLLKRGGEASYLDARRLELQDVLCYLLSLMSSEEQIRIVRGHPWEVLLSFLHWHRQDVCLDIMAVVWTVLDERDDLDMELHINEDVKRHILSSFYYNPVLIQDFFLRCPEKVRKVLMDGEGSMHEFLLTDFFSAGDFRSIRVYLENMNESEKINVFASKWMLDLFELNIKQKKRHLLERFVGLAKFSAEAKKRLKEALVKDVKFDDPKLKYDISWVWKRRFLEFLSAN